MKIKLAYTFAAFMLVIFNAPYVLAQKNIKSKTPIKIEKGALFFEKTFISLGAVQDKQEPIKIVYNYQNIGKGKVTITDIKADCGCSKPQWDKKPISFNQKGEIVVYFFPKELSGNQNKTITVFTDGEPNVYYLKFSAFIDDVNARLAKAYPSKQGNTLFDSYEVKFPKIYNYAADSVVRTMYNPTSKPIKILGIEAPEFIAVSKDKNQISPNSGVTFKIKYKANETKDFGTKLDEIVVHTDDSIDPKKKFLVRANIVEDFEKRTPKEKAKPPVFVALTPVIDIGQVNIKTTHKVTFTITNKGKSPLYIRKIFSSCGCTTTDFDYSKPIKKGKKVDINITYSTNYDIGKVEKQISLITNTPDQTLHNLVLKANIVYTRP